MNKPTSERKVRKGVVIEPLNESKHGEYLQISKPERCIQTFWRSVDREKWRLHFLVLSRKIGDQK
jgi:hypothetical protein